MKKLLLMSAAILFVGIFESLAQVSGESSQSGRIYRSVGSGAERGNDNGISQGSIFGAQGDWSVDLTISEKTPSDAATDFEGPSHSGMGATGWGSFVAGAYNRASGAGAVAIGFHNAAGPLNSDESSIPTSGNTTNLGQFAVGYGTQATGGAAFSSGYGSTASGQISTAMGLMSTASGYASVAMGQLTTASGNYSNALGWATTASGHYSSSVGRNTKANDFASFVIGQYNSSGSTVTSEQYTYSTENTAFVIGNGTGAGDKSDAFKVMFNGDTTISNDLTVSGDVNISSDARLKSNIVSLGSTLSKLLLIDGKSYTMNKSGEEKIGILAQDIQEVFPELVSKDDNEMLSVNYQGLVPVLINAIKEQEDKISRLENLVEQLITEK